MRLLSLEVEAFKKVRHVSVTFGPRVTVLHGPNELGKSTLAEALRAALLVETGKKEGESFIPWGAPTGRARVVLTLDIDGARYRVDKTFGSRAKSVLERADLSSPSTYRHVVDGRGVDGKLRELLSWGVPVPATRGASRKAASFLVTALLGQQGRAADLFEASLANDEIPTGRERVTEALGAMGRDPTVDALLAKLEPRVARSFSETGLPRRNSDAPLVKAREELSKAEDEVRRLREKNDAITAIAAHLAVCMQRHELCEAEVKSRREKLETVRASVARNAEQAQRAAEVAQLRARLAKAEARIEVLRTARAALRVQEASEREAAEKVAACDEAVLSAEANLRTVEVEVLRAKEAAAQQAVTQTERRHADETRAAEVTRAVAAREAAERTFSEAQERLARAVESATAAVGARESAEARHSGLVLALDTARSDLRAQRAAEAQAIETKAAAEVARQALTHEMARRHEIETRVAEERQRATAAREAAQRAHADAIAQRSSAVAAADAAARTREATEARLQKLAEALEATEGKLAAARLAPPISAPPLLEGRSSGRRVLFGSGIGLLLLAATAWFAGAPLPLAVTATILGLAVIAAALRTKRVADAVVTPARPSEDDHVVAAEGGVSDLKAQLAATREALTVAKVDEARTRAELDAAKKLGENLANALAVPSDDKDSRSEAASVSAAPGMASGVRVKEVEEALAAAVMAVSESHAAVCSAERSVADLETEIAVARDSLVAAKVTEMKMQVERDNAQGDAEALGAKLTTAREAETALRNAPQASLGGEGHISLSPNLDNVLAQLTTRRLSASSALSEAQEKQRASGEALADARSSSAKQREAIARIEGEVAPLEIDSVRERLANAARELADRVGDGEGVDEVLDVRKVEEAYEHIVRELKRCEQDLHEAKGRLQQAGGQATRERLEAQRELVLDRRAAFDELEREEKAAYRLSVALRDAEQARTADVGGALAKAVTARFAELTGGGYERVSLDANLADARVSVSGAPREPANLSVGAREQLATLVRLSLAAQLRTVLLLDDQLVHSDAQRHAILRAQLLASSREHDHQIVVLTCRPADYLVPEDADLVAIDLTEMLRGT